VDGLLGDLWKYYWDGGVVMHFITLCSLIGLAVIFYKLVVFRRVKLNLNAFIAQVRSQLLKGNIKGAIQVCEEHRSPIASIVKTGLLKYGQSREQLERSMESAAIHEIAYLEKYLTAIATVTNLAPLLGFFGTVQGMIISFNVIAEAGLNNPGLVAHGISVALLTTAWGLIVAFVCQPFYNLFASKVAAYTREIETTVNILFETFEEMERMGAKPTALER